MLAIETTTPDPSEYAFVLRRYDRHLQEHSINLVCYTGTFDSRWIEIEGIKAHTLFLNTLEERDFAIRRGWQDETDRWHEVNAREKVVPAVLAALQSLASPSVASAVAKTAGLPAADVQPVLEAMALDGRAVKRGNGSIVLWSAPVPIQVAAPVEGAAAGA